MWVMDSLTRGGLGWGETIVDTLIMTYQTSSKRMIGNYNTRQFGIRDLGTEKREQGMGDTHKQYFRVPSPYKGRVRVGSSNS
jgi:hypothetical protein